MRRLVGGAAAILVAVGGVIAGGVIGAAQGPRVIAVSVKKFEFSMPEITVSKGETVIIELTSADRVHGFSVPAFGIRGDIVPGAVTRIVITADRSGAFDFLCDVFCGDEHDLMGGKLIVRE